MYPERFPTSLSTLLLSKLNLTMARENFAIIREATGHATLCAAPIPKVPDDYILVRTVTVALNPTDWTTLDAPGDAGTIVGCDYAGIVEEVGAKVQKFKKGDRVAGWAHGGASLFSPKREPSRIGHVV